MNKSKEKNQLNNNCLNYQIIEGKAVEIKDIENALILDRKFYHIDNSEQFNIDKCLRWYRNNNQIYTMLQDKKNEVIVGYINAAPISFECYEDIKAGKYPDSEIDDTEIVPYETSLSYKTYILYFASIVIDNEKDSFIRFKILYEAFLDKLINFTKQNIIISKIIADAVSEEGKKLCMLNGMKKIKDTEHDNSCIFEFELFPPTFKPRTPKQKELFNVLMEKFKDYESSK